MHSAAPSGVVGACQRLGYKNEAKTIRMMEKQWVGIVFRSIKNLHHGRKLRARERETNRVAGKG
jgi:hypothetical protein